MNSNRLTRMAGDEHQLRLAGNNITISRRSAEADSPISPKLCKAKLDEIQVYRLIKRKQEDAKKV